MTEAKTRLNNEVQMQIDGVRRLLSGTIAPYGAESAGVGHEQAFGWAKTELSIPDEHSDQQYWENFSNRRQTFTTRFPDTFYVETAIRRADGEYVVSAREVRRLGAKAMELIAEDIAQKGVPRF